MSNPIHPHRRHGDHPTAPARVPATEPAAVPDVAAVDAPAKATLSQRRASTVIRQVQPSPGPVPDDRNRAGSSGVTEKAAARSVDVHRLPRRLCPAPGPKRRLSAGGEPGLSRGRTSDAHAMVAQPATIARLLRCPADHAAQTWFDQMVTYAVTAAGCDPWWMRMNYRRDGSSRLDDSACRSARPTRLPVFSIDPERSRATANFFGISGRRRRMGST